MTGQSFTLTPFPAPVIPAITITGTIARSNGLFTLRYSVAGVIEDVLLPSLSAHPRRQDELWKGTCFEFFLAVKDQSQYWEFNMSPSGDWNIYHMDAYRRVGFREETSIPWMQFEIKRESERLTLDAAVDLSPILPQAPPIEVAITAVIQTKDGSETYWALAHPAPHADFHWRRGFTLVLAEQTHPWPQSAPGS